MCPKEALQCSRTTRGNYKLAFHLDDNVPIDIYAKAVRIVPLGSSFTSVEVTLVALMIHLRLSFFPVLVGIVYCGLDFHPVSHVRPSICASLSLPRLVRDRVCSFTRLDLCHVRVLEVIVQPRKQDLLSLRYCRMAINNVICTMARTFRLVCFDLSLHAAANGLHRALPLPTRGMPRVT